MDILFRSLHNLDLTKDEPISKEIPEDFDNYISEYILFATTENKTSKMYTVPDANTTVMNCVARITEAVILHHQRTEVMNSLAMSIARKLLTTEQEVQRRIEHLTEVQRGSIVQALILEDDEYKYVIAKVEHSEWFDGDTLQKNFGFPRKNKKVWKSAVIDISVEDGEALHHNVKVFSQTEALYWANSFLEVKEANSDKVNTETVLQVIERELKRSVRKHSPFDYANLKGTLYHELQSDQIIQYSELINTLFEKYSPSVDRIDKDSIKKKLLLQERNGQFDTQFHADPTVVKKNSKKKYRVNNYINLYVDESCGVELQNVVKGIKDPTSGEKKLVISCDEDDTFATFYKEG